MLDILIVVTVAVGIYRSHSFSLKLAWLIRQIEEIAGEAFANVIRVCCALLLPAILLYFLVSSVQLLMKAIVFSSCLPEESIATRIKSCVIGDPRTAKISGG